MRFFIVFILLFSSSIVRGQKTIDSFTKDMKKQAGFMTIYADAMTNKVYLEIKNLDKEFLYLASLSDGLGSNDIGLDRGKLGPSRLVYFERQGSKILMIQKNTDYRAESNNKLEQLSVEEAFARSVLFSFDITAESTNKLLVDISPMLLSDLFKVSETLASRGQGSYTLDKSRSSIRFDQLKTFPENIELEAYITFSGKPKSSNIRSVTPEANYPTVALHHSLIELPDNKYKKREFRPDCGYFYTSYYDYATPISESLEKRFINRHRLEKKYPNKRRSEAVEPIIYYMDPGCPEPVKTALMEGALWWNEAFEAAGFENAFQVKELPAGADPLDVRYNMIQWVHRSTRGWSYGASVQDPRTGEIIKGHVSLGSLRVRQDFMIAVGLINAYRNGNLPDPDAEAMALARLRQLAAHEVGHTIGLAHNFAASTNERASVMDYPHPLAELSRGGISLSDAYDNGIGTWDKQAIKYGYQVFESEGAGLQGVLDENNNKKLRYITDQDARPISGFHPYAHLWDNGTDATRELRRIIEYRRSIINSFSDNVLPNKTPLSELEKVLVPIYLAPRYQVEATAKLIGGLEFQYSEKGDSDTENSIVNHRIQKDALMALLSLVQPDQLEIPKAIIDQIPPTAYGYSRGREYFKSETGGAFDPVAAAKSLSAHVNDFLLHPIRLNRIAQQHALDEAQFSLDQYLDEIEKLVLEQKPRSKMQELIILNTVSQVLDHYFALAVNEKTPTFVRMALIQRIEKYAADGSSIRSVPGSTYFTMKYRIYKNTPSALIKVEKLNMPDGSPIGACGHFH